MYNIFTICKFIFNVNQYRFLFLFGSFIILSLLYCRYKFSFLIILAKKASNSSSSSFFSSLTSSTYNFSTLLFFSKGYTCFLPLNLKEIKQGSILFHISVFQLRICSITMNKTAKHKIIAIKMTPTNSKSCEYCELCA